MRLAYPRCWHSLAGAAVLIFACASSALPQSRTIRLVNPYPPGGTGDIIARIITDQIARTQNVSFIVEDRPGGGSVIGADVVARAAPDGNTLLINTSAVLINAHLRKLSFDPLAGFEPICNVTQSPQLLFVNSASPYRSMADLVAAARANPGDVTLATTGPFSAAHIGFERFKQIAHVSITHVPFPGNAPTVNSVLGGHVTAGIANYADLVGHFAADKLRPIAAMTPTRAEPLPDLPTVGEQGYKEFEYVTWFGVVAPAKTPQQIAQQLREWFAAARQAPEAKAKLAAQGLFPEKECGNEYAALMRKEYENYGRVVREANIKAE